MSQWERLNGKKSWPILFSKTFFCSHIALQTADVKALSVRRSYDAVRVSGNMYISNHAIGRGIDDGNVLTGAIGDVNVNWGGCKRQCQKQRKAFHPASRYTKNGLAAQNLARNLVGAGHARPLHCLCGNFLASSLFSFNAVPEVSYSFERRRQSPCELGV